MRIPPSAPIRIVMGLISAPDRSADSAASISSFAFSANRLTRLLSDRAGEVFGKNELAAKVEGVAC